MRFISLDSEKMSDIVTLIMFSSTLDATKRFRITCNACSLEVTTGKSFNKRGLGTVRVDLKTKDGSNWMKVLLKGDYIDEMPSIEYFFIEHFETFLIQIKNIDKEYLNDTWDAWRTIESIQYLVK